METLFILNIPLKAPSFNQYYRIMRNRFIITPEGRKFKQEIQDFIKKTYSNVQPVSTPVKIYLEYGFKDNRRRDLDNLFIKEILKTYIYRIGNIYYYN